MTYRPTPDPTSEMSELMETSFSGRTTSTGDIVSGKIVKITGEAAFVDYGAKSEGMVNLAELKDEHGGLLHDVGATLDFVVAETKGYVRLSFRDAQAGKARVALKEAWKKQETVRGRVVGINKGGYEVRIDGVRAFCPLSQLADRFIQDPQSMVGEEFEFRITEWDDHKGAVVSRRALLEAEREKNKKPSPAASRWARSSRVTSRRSATSGPSSTSAASRASSTSARWARSGSSTPASA